MTQYRTCRTCLEANENCCNIFQSTQNNKIISELIMEFVPVMIQRDDNLPDSICNICLEKLNYVIDFREMVAKSHGGLSQQLGNNEWGDIKVELEDSRVSTDLTDWKEDFNEIDQKHVDNKDIGQSLMELNNSENCKTIPGLIQGRSLFRAISVERDFTGVAAFPGI